MAEFLRLPFGLRQLRCGTEGVSDWIGVLAAIADCDVRTLLREANACERPCPRAAPVTIATLPVQSSVLMCVPLRRPTAECGRQGVVGGLAGGARDYLPGPLGCE